MATFFGEVVTGSYRYIDPDQADYNEQEQQIWSLHEDICPENCLLMVSVGDIANNYLKMIGDGNIVAKLSCGNAIVNVVRNDTCTLVLCSGHETGNISQVKTWFFNLK